MAAAEKSATPPSPGPAPEPSQPAAAPQRRERTQVHAERSYWDIVLRQFQNNRLAMVGLWVVGILVSIAVFAPFLANSRPLLFHGYRYRSYETGYDQLVYAHADLFGLGRGPDQKLVIPKLYPEGIFLPGLGAKFQQEQQRWDAGHQTWKQIQDASFGDANLLLNKVRKGLEDALPDLSKDLAWARGQRQIDWLREQKLPTDVERDLAELVKEARKNLGLAYRAKAERRRDAVIQQLAQMREEVSPTDRQVIDKVSQRYAAAVQGDFHQRAAGTLAEFDQMILELRAQLDPARVLFQPHYDFPALRQLDWLDALFLSLALLLATHPLWGRLVPHAAPGQLARRKAAVLLLVPLACALGWKLSVPAFNDTTDYERGMRDGSVYCDFRIMAPLRYGVNDNDTDAKYQAPWWWEAPPPPKAAEDDQPSLEHLEPGLRAQLTDLHARVAALERSPVRRGAWARWLDVLNRHHMGTDSTGRDLMTRMIWGSRISLSIGFVAVGIYIAIGIVIGSLAGYFGGWVDIVVSRVIEIMICFPTFFLILTVIAFVGPSILNIMVVIGVTGWTGVARLVRGEFLRLRKQDFVVAGKALGYSDARIIFRHVLPNALAPVLVAATFGVASAILVESSLSFLGFGVKVPTPTWGSILSAARESYIYWWITLFPGFAIFLTVTMYNLVGEGIRDAVDPKLRK